MLVRTSGTTDPQPAITRVGAAESEQTRARTEMLELDQPECRRLLAATSLGRIAVSVAAWDHPVIRPVNYVFDEDSQSVLIRSDEGAKLIALLQSAKAAFEIDGFDPAGHVGWSVIVVGVTEEVTNPAELRRIARLGLQPWAPGDKGRWVRLRANRVSGRRIASVSGEPREERPPTSRAPKPA
jgi:nitroimidazol reductase NimA-like FMN-containing flavoprotein (pyridoxamine 5'-phosphate oxidase superfamily)